MDYTQHLDLICKYSSGTITLQQYIDTINNSIDNNQVKSYLNNFLSATIEIDSHYGFNDSNESRYFDIYIDNSQLYQYFVCKIPHFGHYCIYVSVAHNHPLYGKSYEHVNNATYASMDMKTPDRWVFGWDYAHFDICTPSILHLLSGNDYKLLLDKKIITVSRIEDDANQYIDLLANLKVSNNVIM